MRTLFLPRGAPWQATCNGTGSCCNENSTFFVTDSTRDNLCCAFVVLPRKHGCVLVVSVAEGKVIASASVCVGLGEVVVVLTSNY